MRVLHVITGLNTGGAEHALYNLLAGGLAVSADSSVLSLQDEGSYGAQIRATGVAVHALNIRRGLPGPRALWRLKGLVRELQPDIIQGWMYHGNLAAVAAAGMLPTHRPALLWNVRQSLYSMTAEKQLTKQVIRANRWGSRRVDAILYNSRLSRDHHEAFGFSAKYGAVIPNGFDTNRLIPDTARGRSIRETLGMPGNTTVIGHVARFHPMKDHATFLRAAVEVMQKRDDVMCLLVGREVHPDNPALAGIIPLALEKRFFFVGERNDVPDLMRAMDVFCQSSWSEAFPNVLGEAMALGVPCVATDVGDSRDIVGDTGRMAPPSDSGALAQELLAMVNVSAEKRAALGRAARLRIETCYSLPFVVDEYRQLYESLCPSVQR